MDLLFDHGLWLVRHAAAVRGMSPTQLMRYAGTHHPLGGMAYAFNDEDRLMAWAEANPGQAWRLADVVTIHLHDTLINGMPRGPITRSPDNLTSLGNLAFIMRAHPDHFKERRAGPT